MAAVSIQLMPAETARCSASCLTASAGLIRMPPVTPPPNASSEMASPVRPKKVFRITSCCFLFRQRPPTLAHALGPELEALDLAGRSLGQLRAELDPARILVRRKRGLHVLLQRARKLLAGIVSRLEDHEGLGLDQLVVVRPRYHRGLQHVRMGAERAFDLER